MLRYVQLFAFFIPVRLELFFRDYDPEPNPPQFDTDTIITTLDYLTKGHGGSVKSLVELLSKSQVYTVCYRCCSFDSFVVFFQLGRHKFAAVKTFESLPICRFLLML